jgi:arylsulfatase A-like enzyme
MNTRLRTAAIPLVLTLLVTLHSCAPQPGAQRASEPAAGSVFDFIAEFDPAAASLGRRTSFGWNQCPFLDSGFDLERGGPGLPVLGRGVLRFDCPWGTESFELELTLRADPPCEVLVTLNGKPLGRPPLKRGPTTYSRTVGGDDLQPRGNLLAIEVPETSVVRLNRLVLPPMEVSVVNGKRRVPILPALPPTRISYRVRPGSGSRLVFETFFRCPPARPPEGVIHFEIMAVSQQRKATLFSRAVRVGKDEEPVQAEPAEVDLGTFAGSDAELVFITRFEGESEWPMAGEAFWGQPRMLPPRGDESQAPLIIWLVDTMRPDHLSCYGYQRSTSPNFDALAGEGLRFEKLTAQSSWTRSSIASLLTGLYPSAHGALDRTDRMLPDVVTLAQQLKGHGYTTAAFSSNGNFYAEDWGLIRGFDEVWGYWIAEGGEDRGVMTAELVDDLFRWLEQHAGEKVFLFIHTVDPHDPYSPPPPFDTRFTGEYCGPSETIVDVVQLQERRALSEPGFDRYERRAIDLYDGEIAYNDAVFGRFVQRLKETGFYQRSVLVVTSDHGEEFSDHQNYGHGLTLFGEQINLPLIIRLPGGRHAGRVVGDLVRQVDLMPSLLRWLGLPASPAGSVSFAEDVEQGRVPAGGAVLAEEALDGNLLYSLIDGRYKYILRLEPRREEALYDLEADPRERTNIIDSLPRIAGPLAERLDAHRREAQETILEREDLEPPRLSADEIANLKALGYLN